MKIYTPSQKTSSQIQSCFSYHPPQGNQAERYVRIRDYAKNFAQLIATNCPESRELSLALTKLEESVMFANASIARNEVPDSSGLEPHQARVVQEKADLDSKIASLLSFIGGDIHKSLSSQEQVRLSWQAKYMSEYSSILGDRIAAFETK